MSFFRSMVVMGSGLALSCGGVSSREVDPDPAGSGASAGSSASGAGGSSAGSAGSGGSSASSGGSGAGGATAGGAAGTTGVAGAGAQGGSAPACPLEQWDCSAQILACDYAFDGWPLPEGCGCDPARPLSASDCPPDTVFTCRAGLAATPGVPELTSVLFECSCQPPTDSGWGCGACSVYDVDLGCSREPMDDPISVICHCALPILR